MEAKELRTQHNATWLSTQPFLQQAGHQLS